MKIQKEKNFLGGWGCLGEGGCERRIEVFVIIQRKFFFFFWGGVEGWGVGSGGGKGRGQGGCE